ncbi:MAG: hypothetical protein QME81_11540 [bacterium]|nr:hypothetical protein [bacterium]
MNQGKMSFLVFLLLLTWVDTSAALDFSGQVGTGYQGVKNTKGEEKSELTTNTSLQLTRPFGQGGQIEGNLRAERGSSITGTRQSFQPSLKFNRSWWEFSLSGKLDENSNIVNQVDYEGQNKSIEAGLKLTPFKFLPIELKYSKSGRENLRDGSTQQEIVTGSFKMLATSTIGQSQTRLSLDLTETENVPREERTKSSLLDITSTIPFRQRFKLECSLKPGRTESLPMDVTTDSLQAGLGLTAQVREGLQLGTNFSLDKRKSTSGETETETTINGQNYTISYQPLPPLKLDTGYELSKTKGGNKSRKLKADLGFTPEKQGFWGNNKLSFQDVKIEDSAGVFQSENSQSNLHSLLNLTSNMKVSNQVNLSTQKQYSVATGQTSKTDNLRLDLRLNHQPFQALNYSLGYGFVQSKPQGGSKNTTNSYKGSLSYQLKLAGKAIPVSLGQNFTVSESGNKETKTRGTDFSFKVPITSSLAADYALGFNQAESETTDNKTTRNQVGLSFKGRRFPFTLQTKFGHLDSTQTTTRTFNATFAYPIWKNLSLDLSYNLERTEADPETTNLEDFSGKLGYRF